MLTVFIRVFQTDYLKDPVHMYMEKPNTHDHPLKTNIKDA